jgi:hypothetical protein
MPSPLISRSLELPNGYQQFRWMAEGKENSHGVTLNDPDGLLSALSKDRGEAYLYTSHQIFYEDGLLKQTRSSPNWEGGLLTYSTCKQHLRTTSRQWPGTWLASLGPRDCSDNCLLMVGRVAHAFPSNYTLSGCVRTSYPSVYKVKQACLNPRGDLYTPKRPLVGDEVFHHENFVEPKNHTRSVEFYKKSPGSRSDRADGLIPKWWRDLEYISHHGHRPWHFILAPCWVFSKPLMWSTISPGRASVRLPAVALGKALACPASPPASPPVRPGGSRGQ